MRDALVTMVGYVGSEVEFKAGEGTPHHDRALFRLAHTPRHRDRASGAWRDGETVWLSVTVWRQLAHHVSASVRVGDPVVAVGRLRTSVWKGDDGQVRSRVVLDATTVAHDLNRGTTVFTRAERATAEPEAASEPVDADVLARHEQHADPATVG